MALAAPARALLQHRVIAATAGAATAVLVVGCAFAATSSNGSGHETLANVSNNNPRDRPTR